MRRLPVALPLALLLGAVAGAAEPASEASTSFRIETGESTRQLRAGGDGKLVIDIVPLGGTHVNAEAPLKISLSSTPGLKLSRQALGHRDAVDPGADGPRFVVPFQATGAGAQEARARVEFFICSDAWCVKQARDVAVAIDVK